MQANYLLKAPLYFLASLAILSSAFAQPKKLAPEHIFIVVMENNSKAQILGNFEDAPFMNALARKGQATNYYGVTHPSMPNYLSLISGDFHGIWDDCRAGADVICSPIEFIKGSPTGGSLLTEEQLQNSKTTPHLFDSKTLVDQLEEAKISWKAYMQSMPKAGFLGEYYPVDSNGIAHRLYAQKHNPFLYFSSIRSNPTRLAKIVPFSELKTDLASDKTPRLIWITPDQCHDIHGVKEDDALALGMPQCSFPKEKTPHSLIKAGDDFIRELFQEIINSKAWRQRSLLIIVWDENDRETADGCCESPSGKDNKPLGGGLIPAIFVRSSGDPLTFSKAANHYTLLATIQNVWKLGCLENSCKIPPENLLTPLFEF